MRSAVTRRLAPFVAAVTLAAGCGYNFEGAGNALPEDIQAIAVKTLDNNTTLEGIELDFTEALIDQFTRGRKVRVVDDPTAADAVVQGLIMGAANRAVSFTDADEVLEFELVVQSAVGLVRRTDGKVIWSDRNLIVREDYAVTADAVVDGGADFIDRESTFNDLDTIQTATVEQREAILRAADEFGRTVYLRMLEDF